MFDLIRVQPQRSGEVGQEIAADVSFAGPVLRIEHTASSLNRRLYGIPLARYAMVTRLRAPIVQSSVLPISGCRTQSEMTARKTWIVLRRGWTGCRRAEALA